jgi:hypothetical protein
LLEEYLNPFSRVPALAQGARILSAFKKASAIKKARSADPVRSDVGRTVPFQTLRVVSLGRWAAFLVTLDLACLYCLERMEHELAMSSPDNSVSTQTGCCKKRTSLTMCPEVRNLVAARACFSAVRLRRVAVRINWVRDHADYWS